MSAQETESADADTDDESTDDGFTYYPQVTQHPTTIIEGEIVDIRTGADISEDVEDTGSSFGVVYEDPEVVSGTLWRNDTIPEGFDSTSEYNDTVRVAVEGTDLDYIRGQEVTEETVEAARERLGDDVDFENSSYDDLKVDGTDFKVADPDDDEASVQYNSDGDQTGIDIGGGEFESDEVDGFGDADRIMVWYGGMSGQFVGRGLDFNGMPFARWNTDNDEAYLVKGLFQVPIGWRGEADIEEFEEVETTDRSKLARAESNGGLGRAPRVARPPILRDDIDGRAFVAIGRYNGGRMYEVHIGRAHDDYEELVSKLLDDELDDDDYDALDMKYDQSPEDTLSAEFDNPAEVFALYTGEGWQDTPEDAQIMGGESDDGGSFDTPDVDVDDDAVDHPTEQEVAFGENVAENIAGTGVSPDDEIFPITVTDDDGEETKEKVDLEGLVEHNSDNFQVTPDVDSIREVVVENTAHL